eukprot:CAMPEP_0117049664 /NCGR_PEP_ID=MMETSP0472-20121206/34291_1 /TAXON_ID=693140 ORGANISM="Tiarina fusus, Strain LIS" /NCGR_SAMPLE_ID=MMETSP0472 /ASSEMBLY_ACC=CAM_ASM_000603 /LENGTH=670 /DNA_ID=CAMNT_0004763153 /DNA_START=66 /DNA_END=2074 /DNA_ORIENTATION=+
MKDYFDKATYEEIIDALDEKKQFSKETMEKFAEGALKWATQHNCTHLTHVFQPLSGSMGEKHDIMFTIDSEGTISSSMDASRLLSGEPDASSFPNGGTRPTHAARGNNIWDPRSYLTIAKLGNAVTMRIPSIFVGWNGLALDFKTPLLRSEVALERETLKVLHLLGKTEHTRVESHCGLEQEFFLIDEDFYNKRPDLMITGRTLFGSNPSRGQDHSDRYFGWQSTRAQDCIFEMEQEFWKLGIPNSTRHREVAPGQYEMAPMFQRANQSNDNNLIMMQVMTEVAKRHKLVCLFHEKPFANLNGSGKHNNWSFGTNEVGTFFSPKSEFFMLAVAAFVRGVHIHGDLLRSSVATSGNDHRLGGHEAPPGIMSIYCGGDITDMIQRAMKGEDYSYRGDSRVEQNFGVPYLPSFTRQACDRNRTSPIAFCGNRFEFRAVGSSVNTAWSTTILNTITAESMKVICEDLEKAISAGVENPLATVIANTLKEHQDVLYEGNGYSEEWIKEAERRKLPNTANTPAALECLSLARVEDLFVNSNVLTKEELDARREVFYSNFCLDVTVELRCFINLCYKLIVPAAYRQLELMKNCGAGLTTQEEAVKKLIQEFHAGLNELKELDTKVSAESDCTKLANFIQSEVRPAMEKVRIIADILEAQVDKNFWQCPTYHEMLNTR